MDDDVLDEAAQTTLQTVSDMVQSLFAHIPFLVSGVLILFATWALAKLVDKLGNRLLGRWKKRASVKELIIRMVGIFVWVLGLLLTAIVLFPGLTPAKALGGLGLVSIAVGLAFKDIFENFFAGILILWRFPFEKGDFVECEGLTGEVDQVMMRMTYIRKTSGELVVVPNSFLFKNPVVVLTSLPSRRVIIMAGIAYDEDVASSVEVIEQAVNGCDSVRQDKPVQIFPQGFGASSIDIEVAWWTGSTPVEVRASRGEVVTAIKKALDNAGIEIPYPYRTLTFKEPIPVTQAEVPVTQADAAND